MPELSRPVECAPHHFRICDAQRGQRLACRCQSTGAAAQGHSRQDQPDSVQSLAGHAIRMLRLGPNRKILRNCFRGRLALMSVIARIIMALVAYGLACLAAALVLTLGSLAPNWNEVMTPLGPDSAAFQSIALWSVTGIAAIIIFSVGFLPALLVIALAEGLALRSAVIYGVAGGLLSLAMAYGLDFAGYIATPDGDLARNREVFAAAGIAGGLVYWLIAGRRAGAWK